MAKVDDMKVGELIAYRDEIQKICEAAQAVFFDSRAEYKDAKEALTEFDRKYGAIARALKEAQ